MFSSFMIDSWIVATIVALVAGTVGFFVVLRGNTFEAHTLPLGAFPGAAAASVLGIDQFVGLLVFSVGAVAGITRLARRDEPQVATALTLVLLLGLGALFLSMTTEYSQNVEALLFGELLGVGDEALVPVCALGFVSVVTTLVLFRPLLLDTIAPDLLAAGGRDRRLLHGLFLFDVALAATTALPVVGALLVFTLMVGPASAARGLTDRPLIALALSAVIALAVTWSAIALSFLSDWPVGFFVGFGGALAYAVGRVARARRGRSHGDSGASNASRHPSLRPG